MMNFIILACVVAATTTANLPALPKPITPSISFPNGQVKSLDVTLTPGQSSFKIRGYWKGTEGFVIELHGDDVNTRMSFRPEEDGSFAIDIDVKNNVTKTNREVPNSAAASLVARGRVSIRSEHDTYLRAYDHNYPGGQVNFAPHKKLWENWYIESAGNEKVALRAIHEPPRYLRAQSNGYVNHIEHVHEWETWTPYQNGDGSWSFLSYSGQWLSASNDGSVSTRRRCGTLEHFWLEEWSHGTIPLSLPEGSREYSVERLLEEVGRRESILQSVAHGTHLLYWKDQDNKEKVVMSHYKEAWMRWTFETIGGKVVLKTSHEMVRYLRADLNGLVNVSDGSREWETWTPYKNDDGSYSFLSFHGKWLSVNDIGAVRTKKSCDVSERFWLVTSHGSPPSTQTLPVVGIKSNTYNLWTETGRRVTIRTALGTYIRMEGYYNAKAASRLDDGAYWKIADYSGEIDLRNMAVDQIIGAEDNGRISLASAALQKWIPYKNNDGSWSFCSSQWHTGKWLSASADGTVRAEDHCGTSEHFWLEKA